MLSTTDSWGPLTLVYESKGTLPIEHGRSAFFPPLNSVKEESGASEQHL